ncbi:hypothetical protein SETIT_1G208200v2 [Setaria italica]|uniref:Uncharacterized protein n=1 Tax=Setaria italica TaxID=4555 RepID=A0A368PMV8_SETIT|nr:hypothetical protein SETIT_1G208200v2 [Setaria italica]
MSNLQGAQVEQHGAGGVQVEDDGAAPLSKPLEVDPLARSGPRPNGSRARRARGRRRHYPHANRKRLFPDEQGELPVGRRRQKQLLGRLPRGDLAAAAPVAVLRDLDPRRLPGGHVQGEHAVEAEPSTTWDGCTCS